MALKKISLVLFCITLLETSPWVQAAPIFSPSPRTQFFLGTAFRTFGQLQRFTGGGNTLNVRIVPTVFSYAPMADASLRVSIPYIDKEFDTPNQNYQAHGMGDITVFGKYRFFRRDLPFGRDQITLLGGLELPTGSTSKGPGIESVPALQTGSGSVDMVIGIAAATTRKTYSIEAALRLKINSEAEDVRFGNVLLYDLALARSFYPGWPRSFSQLNLLIELNGRTSKDIEISGVKRPTGGTVLFISPGIQHIMTENFLVELGIQLPLVLDFPDQGMEPDYAALFGVRYLF